MAHIEVVRLEDGTECLYYGKDDGVGFDPEYTHTLLGVFQRLCGLDEFDSTGISLVIVRRVVTRHGGRAMAEGKVEAGAIFRFTLPAKRS